MFQLSKNIPSQLITGFPITQAVVDGKQQGYFYASGDNYFIVHKAGFASLISNSSAENELLDLFQQKTARPCAGSFS